MTVRYITKKTPGGDKARNKRDSKGQQRNRSKRKKTVEVLGRI